MRGNPHQRLFIKRSLNGNLWRSLFAEILQTFPPPVGPCEAEASAAIRQHPTRKKSEEERREGK